MRRQPTPYWLMLPGGACTSLIFLVLPLCHPGLHVAAERRRVLRAASRSRGSSRNYTDRSSQYQTQFVRSVVYSVIVTVACLLLAYPMTYWIAFYGGRWKSSILLLILLPFFVSFVIRTIQWKFILGRQRADPRRR